jgi:glycosyltransferase involved in cell wall biosynthesis
MVGNENSVLIDCERMKTQYTGLYYFCLHLSLNLLLTNEDNKNLCFYTQKKNSHLFKDECILAQYPVHKFVLPSLRNYQIWHSTYQGSQYYPWNRKIKVVLTIHDLNFMYDNSKSAAKKEAYLKNIKTKIERADHIVTISNFTLSDLKKHIDLKDKPASVIYNGGNVESIINLTQPAYIPPTQFLFTIGAIVAKKNFHVLPALLKGNDMVLVIAGIAPSEEYKKKIIAEAKNVGVENRVIFTGAISENDKQWYMKNCQAFLFPSLSEGFGLPVVEAMHFGKPVILSDSTSLPEIGGNEAYYFNSFEPSDMQNTLTKSLENYHSDKMQKESSIIERSKMFNWLDSAKQYHAVYNSLLG